MKHVSTPTLTHHALAAILYLGLALLTMAPVLPHATTMIWGGVVANVDGWQNVWHLWWVAQAVSTGQNPFETQLLFYPVGAKLYLQPLNVTTGLLLWPVTLLVGPIAAYNLSILLSLVLGGLASYWLAWEVSHSYPGALIAGLAFAWSPFHLTKIYDGQIELAAIQWPAFYALFLLYALRERRLRDALIAGVLLAMVGYATWYYLLFMLVWSVGFGLLYLSHHGSWLTAEPGKSTLSLLQRGWSVVRQGSLIGLVALLLLAPALVPGLASRLSPDPYLPPVDPQIVLINSVNLLDLGLPSYLHPLWGEAVFARAGSAWHPLTGGWNAALGYSILLLVVLGSLGAHRSAWPWLALALLGISFALGPVLQVGLWQAPWPMPYQWLNHLPGADVGRRPLQFMLLTTLALAPLVALGLRELLARTTQREGLVTSMVLVLMLVELLPMRGMLYRPDVHRYYAQLGPESGAILNVPLPLYKNPTPQLMQIEHGAPLIAGYLARIPRYPLLDAPGIRPLRLLWPEQGKLLEPRQSSLSALNYYGVRQIIVDWPAIYPDRQPLVAEAVAQSLPGVAPIYADAKLSAYLVPQQTPTPFAFFGAGWYDEEGPSGQRWRWMGASSEMILVNPTEVRQRAVLDLNLTSYRSQREVTLTLDNVAVAVWTVPAQPGEHWRRLHLLLPPGEHTLELAASTTTEQVPPARELSVALIDVDVRWVPEP